MARATRTPHSLLAMLGLATLLGVACESPSSPRNATGGDVPVRITAITVGTPISTLVVEVTAADLPASLVFNLTVVNGVAAGTIKIPPGPARAIHVTAVDDQGVVTHEGGALIDVRPGQNPPLQIKLAPRSGHVPITVTFGNFGVLVSPAAATIDLATSAQLRLSATVTDVNGQVVPAAEVGWATTQPAVATVSASGLVTGVKEGAATIVATFEGVAGLSAITVKGIGVPPPQGAHPMDYYVAYPANADLSQTALLSLRLTGNQGVGGTVIIPGMQFSATFTTDATGLAVVSLPNAAMLDAWDKVEPRGVIVHADDSLGVLAISEKPSFMTPVELLPATVLGLQHSVMSAGAGSFEGSFLALVGTVDATTVTIVPTAAVGARAAGAPFQVTLNRGDAYQLEANGLSGDLTGTAVQSDKPIGVFGGHIIADIPANTCCAGMLWAAIPPVPAVTGKDFLTFPLSQRTGYRLRVMALQPGTIFETNGIAGLATRLETGQVTEARTTTPVRLVSNVPVVVALEAEGLGADGGNPNTGFLNPGVDPCFTLLQPVTAFASTYVFDTPISQVTTRYANIIAPTAAVGTIALNGAIIDVSRFTAIYQSGYAGATVSLSAGVNRISSSGAAFGVVVYGWDGGSGANGFCFSPHPEF